MSALNSMIDTVIRVSSLRASKTAAPELGEAVFRYAPAPVSERYVAGYGKRAVLPDDIEEKKYYIAGYSENNPARGVIDPQYACALWLDDGAGGILLISLDVVGLLQQDVNRLKDGLADFCRLSGCRDVHVFSTHNHAGIDTMGLWGPLPRTGRNKKFMRLLFECAKDAAIDAYESRRPGRLFAGETEVPDMQEDIRLPEVYSKRLTRLRFAPDDGSNEIWLVNFASHSESLQGCNHLVSADFPGYLRERIRVACGAETLYTVGAIGGMISMRIPEERLLRREHRLLESTRAIGTKLADYALGIREETELAPRISRITQPFYVPVENPLLTIAAQVGIIPVDRYFLPAPAVRSQITYMELDGLPLLMLPCELFPELAYGGCLSAEASATGKGPEINPPPLLETVGSDKTVIFGLADDELGYVLPPNDFYLHPDKPYLGHGIDRLGRRHYEETNSAGPGTAKAISDTLTNMMKTVNETKQAQKEGTK